MNGASGSRPLSSIEKSGVGRPSRSKLELGRHLGQGFEPGIGMRAGIREPERIQQRRDDRREPAVAAHRIDQIEDEKRVAGAATPRSGEIEIDGDDLGGKAERRRARRPRPRRLTSVSISSGRVFVAACTTGMKPPGFSAIRRVSAAAPGWTARGRNARGQRRGSCRSARRRARRSARRGWAGRNDAGAGPASGLASRK